jgi:phage gp16-like protein
MAKKIFKGKPKSREVQTTMARRCREWVMQAESEEMETYNKEVWQLLQGKPKVLEECKAKQYLSRWAQYTVNVSHLCYRIF